MNAMFSDRMGASIQSSSLAGALLTSQKDMDVMGSMGANFAASAMGSMVESQKQFADIGKGAASIFASDSMDFVSASKNLVGWATKRLEPNLASSMSKLLSGPQNIMGDLAKDAVSSLTSAGATASLALPKYTNYFTNVTGFNSASMALTAMSKPPNIIGDLAKDAVSSLTSAGALASMRGLKEIYDFDVANLVKAAENLWLSPDSEDSWEDFLDAQDRYNRAHEAYAPNIERQKLNAPKNSLSREFYINFFMALLLFALSQYSQEKNKEELFSLLNKHNETVVSKLIELDSNNNENIFYVAGSKVRLRAEPYTESEILSLLHTNLEVRMVEKKPSWIKVKYFDNVEGSDKSGWVFKKYLKEKPLQ